MDMLPTAEQQQIIDSVREFFASEYPLERLQARAENSDEHGRSAWRAMGELGYFGLGLAEGQGGFGYTLAEELLLLREAGRFLVTPMLMAQVIGARIACLAGLNVQPFVCGAERVALLAPIGSAHIGATVSGEFHMIDARDASWLVVWDQSGAALLRADAIDSRTEMACLDDSVALDRAQLTSFPAHAFVPGDADDLSSRVALYMAAQLVGIAAATRDMAVEYAKVRCQFDQPIGAFQAIKHRCADMALRTEAAWSQTVFAALAVLACDAAVAELASAAVLLADTAARENAAANVHVHGAMGYTTECSANRFVKRARVLERLLGSSRQYRYRTLGLLDTSLHIEPISATSTRCGDPVRVARVLS